MSNPTVYAQVKSVFDKYGVPPAVWYPIALAESNLNPDALGDNGASIGIFQINRVSGQGIGYTADQLRDPITNADVAARAIAPAYNAVKDSASEYDLAAEVARRSGHPGGSITNPFNALDPRILRIKLLAKSFLDSVNLVKGLSGQNDVVDAGAAAGVQSANISNNRIDAISRALNPLSQGAQGLTNLFNTMGAPGFVIGSVGAILIVLSLGSIFAETDAGRSVGAAVKAAV